ncbi:MAG: NCS2 family permease [Deltaproteobacteria bacterium]|nr:NCS2 family permease [Deltaproteobacteria bacterium]
MQAFIEKFFHLKSRRTTVKTELLGGTVTFFAMAYIIFVEPAVLSMAGMDFNAVMVATCLGAALICLLMGVIANYPIAGAPLMGENFFFVFVIVKALGFTWQQALAAVLIEGILFMVLTSMKLREVIIDAIPSSLKQAMATGIGIFIAFIGLKWAGIIITDASTGVAIGNLKNPAVITAIIGLFITVAFVARKIKGALLWGIGATALIGLFTGAAQYSGIVSAPPSIAPVFMKFDFSRILTTDFIIVVFVLLYMEIFDTIGTIIGIGEEAGLIKDNKLPEANRVLFVDAFGTFIGSCLGTSTVSSYIESNAGVTQGARTGLASVTTGALFLLALFFSPLVKMVGGGVELGIGSGNYIYPITAPALIIVGFLMIKNVVKLDFSDATESLPAYLTIVGIPLTYNIAHGIAFGIVSYPVIKLLTGRGKEASILMYVLAAVFILKYALVKI